MDEREVDAVTAYCLAVLGPKDEWLAPPGWPGSLALCLLDSAWSIDSDYEAVVRPLVGRYRDHRRAQGVAPEQDSLADLLRVYDEVGGPDGFAARIGNRRPAHTKPGAPSRAQAVHRTAEALLGAGVGTTADLLRAVAVPHGNLKRAWRRVPGNGAAGWRYLLMLAGDEHVKPDRMVRRFVAAALAAEAGKLTSEGAARLLEASADTQAVTQLLDHTVWRFESARARTGRRNPAAAPSPGPPR